MNKYLVAVQQEETRFYTDGAQRGKPYKVMVWRKRTMTEDELCAILDRKMGGFLKSGDFQVMTSGTIELCDGFRRESVAPLYQKVVEHHMKPGKYLKKYYRRYHGIPD